MISGKSRRVEGGGYFASVEKFHHEEGPKKKSWKRKKNYLYGVEGYIKSSL